jgi:TPR repeat protein
MYADGVGVARNDAEAVRWLRLAAEQGHPLAQATLGFAYAGWQTPSAYVGLELA